MALIPWWIRYPNVNDEIMNLDWLLRVSNENTAKISNFINLNTIKYANPILWDITSQYEANTITVDPQTGDAYISTKAVPYGVALSNTDYWTKIYNYANEMDELREQIAAANEELSTTATAPRAVGDLVWLNGLLYKVTAPMIAGDSYVVGSNCKKITIEELLDASSEAIETEAEARAEADEALGERITAEAEARAEADTALNERITNEIQTLSDEISDINNYDYVTPEMFGAVGDGTTDDSGAINLAIKSKKPVKFLHNYAIGSPIEVNYNDSEFIDGQGFVITALPNLTEYMMKVNKLYGVIKNITLNGSLLTTLNGGMLIYSTTEYQAQFLLIDNLYIKNCQVGIQYGDGTRNAQSENTIHGYRTRSVIVPLDINQPNGMLWVTDSHLDATPYEWVSAGITPTITPYVIFQHIGGLCIDNCTLESPSYANRSMILYDAIVTNCIIEIAGINVQIINYGATFRSELTFENCRFYESQGENFITVGGGNTNCKLTLSDCNIYGSGGLLIYSTIKLDVVLNNVYSSKALMGININLLDANNVYLLGADGYNPLVKKHLSGVKFVKGTKEFLGTAKITHDNNGQLVASYCYKGNLAGSEVLGAFVGNGVDYITFDKFNTCEVFQLGVTNGTLEVTLFTVDNGEGFTNDTAPANAYYPDGSIVVDSSGTTKGWLIAGKNIITI